MSRTRILAGCLIAAIAAGLALLGAAGPEERPEAGPIRGTLWHGQPGMTETIDRIMERESAFQASGAPPPQKQERKLPRPMRRANPDSPAVSRWPPPASEAVISPEPSAFQSIGTSFVAVTHTDAQWDPPDTIGAVGPTQILVVLNGRVRVFSRTGQPGPLDTSLTTFFGPVNGGVPAWDPQVRYDRLSERWFITALNDGLPNRILIAASSGPVITASSSFTFFQFRQDEVIPTGHADGWADYDGLGVDRLSLYIGVDIGSAFPNVEFLGTDGFVVNKADLLNGLLTVTVFRGMFPGGNRGGPDDPRGVSNDDPQATEGYFIGPDVNHFGRLVLRRITYPGGVPAISNNITLNVPQTNFPVNVPHAGMLGDNMVNPEDDRLFVATITTNKLTGARRLWTAHNIQVDGTGVASDVGDRNGTRWYEIGNLASSPTLIQSGTIFDPVSLDPRHFVIPSAAMSGQGHVTIGFTTAGRAARLDAGAVGRLAGDPPGTTRPFMLLTSSSSAYNFWPFAIQPWGDYSQTLVDPNDDMTFWTFQEYCHAENDWGVRVVELKAPPPATPVTAAPSTFCPGVASTPIVVTGSSVSGSGFFDPGADPGGPGFANHIAASMTGGVAVTSVQFDTPLQVTLHLSTVGAAAGSQDITITNPDGQSATGPALLTISPAPAAPAAANNGPLCAGATLQLSASSVPQATYQWSGPNGFSSTLQNPSIPGAGTAANGVYSVTVSTGGCPSAPSTTLVMMIPGGEVCNDGNPCTGGETCQAGACQGGVPTDADADAHPDGACGGTDCNDTNPSVWAAPGEVTNLDLLIGDPTGLAWDSQGVTAGPETVYDLISGPLAGGAGIDFATGACLQVVAGPSYFDDRPDPPPGGGFWYLTRARNSCGTGTYGSGSRDTGAPPCP